MPGTYWTGMVGMLECSENYYAKERERGKTDEE